MNRFARWIVKHRVAVVIICLLMLIPSVLRHERHKGQV